MMVGNSPEAKIPTVKEIAMAKPEVAVSTMDAIHGRRSVRAYTPQKLDHATYAPC